jgi:hypothetical protein
MSNQIKQFFTLNLIAYNINPVYKYKTYLLILIISLIASLLIRSDIIFEYNINPHVIFIAIFLSFIYSIKLIFDIFIKGVYALKAIPMFYKLIKENKIKNINSIITLYFLQNLLFVYLFLYVLSNILYKLNDILNYSDFIILILGLSNTVIFTRFYPIKSFRFNSKIKDYSLIVWFSINILSLFYILFIPSIFILLSKNLLNVIDSNKTDILYMISDSKKTNKVDISNSNNKISSNVQIEYKGNSKITITDNQFSHLELIVKNTDNEFINKNIDTQNSINEEDGLLTNVNDSDAVYQDSLNNTIAEAKAFRYNSSPLK